MTINIKVVTHHYRGHTAVTERTAAVRGPLWLFKDGPELVATLITLRHSFDLSPFICTYILSNMIELIGVFKLYRFMVTESIDFHILPRLS